MTCQECQPLAIDLARGLPPFDVGGAVQRADLLSHIATCKQCARWLRQQEALSNALRATAAADASLAAPADVEANVMAAWRARQTRQAATANAANLRSQRLDLAQQPDQAWRRSESRWAPRTEEPPRIQGPLTLTQPETVAQVWSAERRARAWRFGWPAGRAAGLAAAAMILIAAVTVASLRWLNPARGPGQAPVPVPAPAPASTLAPPAAPALVTRSAADAGTSSAAGASRSAAASSPIAGRASEGMTETAGAPAALGPGTATPGTVTPGSGRPGAGTPGIGAPAAGTNAAVIEVLPDKRKKATKGPPSPPRATTSHAANTVGFDGAHGLRTASGATRGATHRGSGTRAVNVARDTNEFNGRAFVLLPYVEPLRPTEMRHIMRVRMPRAQLAAGELRAGGVDDAAVLADVIVGEDGTARAVRIVQ